MITLQDVALKAEVSKTTVSLVLNNHGNKHRISEDTRKKVLQVAEALDYNRNDLAIAVKTGKSKVIAFVSFNLGTWEYVGKIMSGILKETTKNDYSLKVYDFISEAPETLVKKILQQRIAGVIFHTPKGKDFEEMQRKLMLSGIFCGVANLNNTNAGIGVTSDDFCGMKEAVGHLADFGHRKITYISRKSNADYVKIRENGFVAGIKEYLPDSTIDIRYVPDARSEGNYEPLKKILNVEEKKCPTALICFTDGVAITAMQVAYDLNIRIPEQLAVIGFGGLEIGSSSVIPLTTVGQPFEQIGRDTASKLINAIDKDQWEFLNESINLKLPTELIIRKSTMYNRRENT